MVPILLTALLVTGGVWRYGFLQQLDQLSKRGTADVSLVLDGLAAELQRYRDLAVLLAEHPTLTALTGNSGHDPAADALLQAAADRTAAAALYFVAADGRILAGSQTTLPAKLRDATYFKRALNGALGIGHGTDDHLHRRLFYFAAPSFGPDGTVQAALVVLADVENFEVGWRGGATAIFLVDDQNAVFMSNRSELLGWRYAAGTAVLHRPDSRPREFNSRKISHHEIWQLNLGPYLPETALILTQSRPRIRMTGQAFVDTAPARQIAWLQAAAVGTALLFFGSLLFLTQERRRNLARANAELEQRVAERTTTLTRTNEALRREVLERHEAEAALKQAQSDLVQAGKLSALGQMSAGISHELNQPLMAIQQFAANGKAFLQRDEPAKAGQNLSRIDDMARRMSRIIRNLRAFARNENEPMGQVDIVTVMDAALELTGPRLRSDAVELIWHPPSLPVWVRGGEVRLEQVMVNLITNAADAMNSTTPKRLEITVSPGNPVVVTLRDSGPGIADTEKIFEPFYSTKQVGSAEGMGLGLSISYGLVQSFGGNIRGTNTGHGAEFSVELEPWIEKDRVA